MQLLLQLRNAVHCLRIFAPLIEALANGIVDLVAFIQKYAGEPLITGFSLEDVGFRNRCSNVVARR